jgi:hypothetical protein
MYYSTLKETGAIPDISDPSAGAKAAVPATIRIHAVHVADGEIACGYTSKADDIAEPDRDWFDDVPPGELPCEACRDAIQPDVERRATP